MKPKKPKSPKYLGCIYTDKNHPITANEIHLYQTEKSQIVITKDFITIENKHHNPQFFAQITSPEEQPLYSRSGDALGIVAKCIGLDKLSRLPLSRLETKVIHKSQIVRVQVNEEIKGTGNRPSMDSIWRGSTEKEIVKFLNFPDEGIPFFLLRSNGDLYLDPDDNPVIVKLDPKAPLHGMLGVGGMGSGKTMLQAYLSWWFAVQYKWAAIVINNKANDLLHLDQPAKSYKDPNWSLLGLEPKGISDFQIIYPESSGCSRLGGPKVPFTLLSNRLRPEALTVLLEFTERGAVHLPSLFKNWQTGGGGTILDFTDYLETRGRRVGTYVHYNIYISNRPLHIKIHSSTVDSIISILQGHSRYFDGKGLMPRADELVKAGKVTAIDLSRATPLVCKLMIQHYLHEIRDYQKLILEMKGKDNLTNVLLGIDEAHQWFKRYTTNQLNRAIETELETHIKLSRSLGIATILNSQLGSELHPAATRLSTVKILLRSE